MRMYPAKCPKCGNYAEPLFNNSDSPSRLMMDFQHDVHQEADRWFCETCDEIFTEDLDS